MNTELLKKVKEQSEKNYPLGGMPELGRFFTYDEVAELRREAFELGARFVAKELETVN